MTVNQTVRFCAVHTLIHFYNIIHYCNFWRKNTAANRPANNVSLKKGHDCPTKSLYLSPKNQKCGWTYICWYLIIPFITMQIFSYKKRYDFVRYDQISAIHCPMTNFYLQLTAKTPTVRKQICKWALIIFPASALRKARQWMATNENNMSWHLPITKPKYIHAMT